MSRRRRRRARLVGAVVAVVTLVAGCGLSEDSAPRNINLAEQPIGLQPRTPPSAIGEPDILGARVYFLVDVNGAELRAVGRDVDKNYEALLDALMQGPTPGEQAEGIFNQIPAGTRLLNVSAPDEVGTIAVDLSEEFLAQQQGPAVGNALGQIVLTATEDNEVQRVVVTVAGNPTPWVIGDSRVPAGTGMARTLFQHINPTEFPEPGVPTPTAPSTTRPAPTTTRDRPSGAN